MSFFIDQSAIMPHPGTLAFQNAKFQSEIAWLVLNVRLEAFLNCFVYG